ncbi:nucleoside-diphosphate sugar epimerase [Polynucleobacter tropicus]|uniref:Nucleoside-diphosphate sugar epimerase n=1 Tax=Polynucleobacter tropicus TaxID=1743174 RepID=A0A6M9Q1W6_9BURK|nr:nucleoside-diphosphate sugar epimerase/dehydratase [Polynucleobacter tropicus]QKM64056.1 nucleoside-diphosphate sugar epimerase [Polynucleobacter tropicus]
MIANHQKIHRISRFIFLVIGDCVLSISSTALIYWIRLDGEVLNPLDRRVIGTYALALLVGISVLALKKIYDQATRFADMAFLGLVVRACIGYWGIFFPLTILLNFFGFEWVSKYVGLIQPILFCSLIIVYRLILQSILGILNKKTELNRRGGDNIYIYGTSLDARHLAESIYRLRGHKVVGFVENDPTLWGRVVSGIKIYSMTQFADIARNKLVDELIVALPAGNSEERRIIFGRLVNLPLRVRVYDAPPPLGVEHGSIEDSIRELDLDELIDRESFNFDYSRINQSISGKVVMVTGAAGSIGSEISRQVLGGNPKLLILFDHSEHDLYRLEQDLAGVGSLNVPIKSVLGSILDVSLMQNIIEGLGVQVIFHAAAYKHVPLLESNLISGIQNNVLGTISCVDAALFKKVEAFILISTDKAVRPTSLMGATKRLAEMYVQAAQQTAIKNQYSTKFSIVRFGNVLGSSGSVIPLFRAQIMKGGPITVTSPDVTRYFMTIGEAVHLVLNAFAMGAGGEVFLLDMGEAVKIIDLAKKVIQFSGLSIRSEINPNGDIEIVFIGLRPGEKLYEELLLEGNPIPTLHPKIYIANEPFQSLESLEGAINAIKIACHERDEERARILIMGLVEKVNLSK